MHLSALELLKDLLEILSATSILESVLVIGKSFKFHLVELLLKFLLKLVVFQFKSFDFSVVLFLDSKNKFFFLVSYFIIVLLNLDVNLY